MGIYKLMSLLQEKAPDSIKKAGIEVFSGRTIACDASMAMYQFLVTTQGFTNNALTELTDKNGNKTGHLVGLFNRSIQFLENGIKPIWIFDGKPPTLKSGELARRKKVKEEALDKMEEAKEEGNLEEALKQKIRTTSISSTMKEDAKKMLALMGMPVYEAPCEAEAQCAALCKAGKVYATATEDMDALTFGTKYLLRGIKGKGEPVVEISYDEALKGLDLTHSEFVDLCILCGCDYSVTIDGIGPMTAYKLIKEHRSIEKIIQSIESEDSKKKKYNIPKEFRYQDARELFITPVVDEAASISLVWQKPNEEELKKFLCEEKGFSESRVESGIKKIKNIDTKGYQSRIESFFGKPVVTKKKETPKTEKGKADKGNKGTKKVKTEKK